MHKTLSEQGGLKDHHERERAQKRRVKWPKLNIVQCFCYRISVFKSQLVLKIIQVQVLKRSMTYLLKWMLRRFIVNTTTSSTVPTNFEYIPRKHWIKKEKKDSMKKIWLYLIILHAFLSSECAESQVSQFNFM